MGDDRSSGAGPRGAAGRPRDLLQGNRDFGSLWLARLISFAGDQLTLVALTLLVHQRHGTGPAVAGLLIGASAPRLLGPLAGTIADRVEQRNLMRGCELGRAAVVTVIAFTLPSLPVLLFLVAIITVLATLFMPAGRSAVPVLVAHHDLVPANALLATGMNLGFAIGPAIGGGLVALIGTSGTLLVDAGTSLIGVLLLGRLPALHATDQWAEPAAATGASGPTTPRAPHDDGATEPDATDPAMPPVPVRPVPGLRSGLVEGLRYAWGERTVRGLLIGLFAGVALAGMGNVAAVFLIRDTLGAGPVAFGVFGSAWGAGMIVGSLILTRWGRDSDPTRVFAGGWLVTGAGIAGAGMAPGPTIAIGAHTFGGVGNGLDNVALDTAIQRVVPRRLLGRAFGVVYTGAVVGELVSFAVAGPLLEATGPRTVFVIAGLGTILIGVWLLLALPRLGPPSVDGRV